MGSASGVGPFFGYQRRYGPAMSNQYAPTPDKFRIGAGTAFKVGFFGALGAFVCAFIIYAILGVIAVVLFAAGLLPYLGDLFDN